MQFLYQNNYVINMELYRKFRTTYITLETNTKFSVKSFLFYVLDLAITMNSRLLIIALIGGFLFSCEVTAGKITLNVDLIYNNVLNTLTNHNIRSEIM